MQRILSILLENESGALSRVIGLFSQRGYNIESLTVAPMEDGTLSKITIQTHGNQKTIEQIQKQLHKLIDVIKVIEIDKKNHIEREIILIKINILNLSQEKEIKNIIKKYNGEIINTNVNVYTIQVTGTNNYLNNFLNIVTKFFSIIELVRSGIISITKD